MGEHKKGFTTALTTWKIAAADFVCTIYQWRCSPSFGSALTISSAREGVPVDFSLSCRRQCARISFSNLQSPADSTRRNPNKSDLE